MEETRPLEPGDPIELHEGRYTNQSVLGEGSMGRTYLAKDNEGGGVVAIKALYPSRLADWKDLELFNREASILQRLNHPQIPSYVDAFHEGEGDGVCYYLVQSYVSGQTLREVIDGGKRFDEAELIELAKKLLTPLMYLHDQDPVVVHRDIKPANLIIKDDVPTLVDFGAVREVVRLTMRGGSTIIGTYGYMPPEQLMGRALPATDVYALGITLVECLTHQTPNDLHGADSKRLVEATQVSPGLKRLLSRMVAPSLAERFESADQVFEDLERVADGRAMVHVGKIEVAIEQRVKEEKTALEKLSKPAIGLTYVVASGSVGIAALLAVFYIFNALASGFEAAFIWAGIISAFGLMMNLVLLGSRYQHDVWEPPNSGWIETSAVVDKFVYELQGEGHYSYMMEYSFPYKGARHSARRLFPGQGRRLPKTGSFDAPSYKPADEDVPVPIGSTFRVWFPPGKPQMHETVDVRRPGFVPMEHLFDRKVVHTPE